MKKRNPIISKNELRWNLLDWFYEIGGWILLLTLWIYIFLQYKNLPISIPTHFALDGTPDGYSNKENIFLLPAIITILFSLMTILNNFPHIYRYMVTITPINARQNYLMATKKVRFLKFILVILFCFISFQSIRVALNQSEGLGKGLLPAILIIFIIITFLTLFRAARHTHVSNY